VNLEHVRRISERLGVPIQVGGGLRDARAVREAIAAGAARVVLGTAALRDVDFLDEAIAEHRERLIVSVDVRDGRLAASGWTEQTEIPVESVIDSLGRRGVLRFVYSSIERDGMLNGPDLEEVARVAEAVRGSFVYSGGVGSLNDLSALAELRQVNLTGVIVGKALYEGRFQVSEAQAALELRD
jgi:phosphoribosylformimino-5-aminoimidazole carboxamide ribotide isomerase